MQIYGKLPFSLFDINTSIFDLVTDLKHEKIM